jgi:hypothetical protein
VLHGSAQVAPLQVAVALASVGHGVHDDPHVRGLVFDTHAPEQMW